jgi:hypothetical protein
MNYKIPQNHQEEGSNHQERAEQIHSSTDSQPSSNTPSPLSTTPVAQNNFNASTIDQLHYQPNVTSQNSSSSAPPSVIYAVPTSIDMSPGYHASPSTASSSSSPSNTGYFTSINGMFHSSVPSQSHYTTSDFEYSGYVPQQQTPPLPLPIQRITSQKVHPSRKRGAGRVASYSPPSSLPSTDQEQYQQSQNKRQKRLHDRSGPVVSSSEIAGRSVSPHSNSITPLPSPIFHHQNGNITTGRTVVDRGGGIDAENRESGIVNEEPVERSPSDTNEQHSLSQPQSPQSQQPQSPPQPQQIQQQQRTVKSIETQISFLKDECATILMMLRSLRTAFLADDSTKQEESIKNKKMGPLKDRKQAMEREMRIAYDDLMLQVRQLERKVEKLEERSQVICRRG